MTIKKTALAVSIGAAVALTTFASQAEITVLKQDPQAGNPLSRLNFTVGGSNRQQFQNLAGDDGYDNSETGRISTISTISGKIGKARVPFV